MPVSREGNISTAHLASRKYHLNGHSPPGDPLRALVSGLHLQSPLLGQCKPLRWALSSADTALPNAKIHLLRTDDERKPPAESPEWRPHSYELWARAGLGNFSSSRRASKARCLQGAQEGFSCRNLKTGETLRGQEMESESAGT
ncbi:hypothetical protein P7K49_009052 [Saguinus oedipus]|uniref:Uncharacterized protein n=1 Tax=Saguinus oedipus TaxID=9490 RepID=A0ABQ9W077_SAGOE|nr:hypothetical protein P7K49_009052 [Saguinus oedipus]